VSLASPIGSAAGGSVNLSTSWSNVVKLAAHPKFVWVFNANCDGTMTYNDPVHLLSLRVEVSLVSPEIEDRNAVERSTKGAKILMFLNC
jgi:hypothetical protein